MATDLEKKSRRTQHEPPQMPRSSFGAREHKKAVTPLTVEVETVSMEEEGGTSATPAFAASALKFGRGAGAAVQSTLAHESVCVDSSLCEVWQRPKSFSLRNPETVIASERAGKTTVDSSRGTSKCTSYRNNTKRPTVPGSRASGALSVSKRETGAASWAAVAAGGVGGYRRPAAGFSGHLPRSSADAPRFAGRVDDVRRASNTQNGSPGSAEQSLSGSRETILSSGITNTSRPHNTATDDAVSGQRKAEEADGLLNSASRDVQGRQDPCGCSTLTEREEQRRHNVDAVAENQVGKTPSTADPSNPQPELREAPPSAAGCARAVAAPRACVHNNADSASKGRNSFTGGIHTRAGENVGTASQGRNFTGCAETWPPHHGEASRADETCGSRLGEDDSGLAKLLQLLPRASNQTSGGLDARETNVGFPWESLKQPEGSPEHFKVTGNRDSQLGAIQQPPPRDWDLPSECRNPSAPGGKSASSNNVSEAETLAVSRGERASTALDAFRGDIGTKNTTPAIGLGTEQEEKGHAAAAAKASQEIAFLIGQWPQRHQPREHEQGSKQSENTCLAEVVCHGNTRGKIQMGVFTETSPLDESVMAAWLPNVAPPPSCPKGPLNGSEQQRCAHPLAEGNAFLGISGMRKSGTLSHTDSVCTEAGLSSMQSGDIAAGVSLVAKFQERHVEQQQIPHYQQPPARVDSDACTRRLNVIGVQNGSASESPAQGRMEKPGCGTGFTGFQWPADGIGATVSKESQVNSPHSRSEEAQQPLWLQSWTNGKYNAAGTGIRDADLAEQQMLQRFVLSLEKKRSQQRNEESNNCILPASLEDAMANALTMNASSPCAAPPTSTPPPPPPPPPPSVVSVAGAFQPEWLQQSKEETGDCGAEALQKVDGRPDHGVTASCGANAVVDTTFQNEVGNFLGGIRPPPGLAARGMQHQQQNRRFTESERTFGNSLQPGTPSRDMQSKAFSQDLSSSVASQHGRATEKRISTRLQDGTYGHGSFDRLDEMDLHQQRLTEHQLYRHSFTGSEGGGDRRSTTTEQGQQLWKQQPPTGQLAVSAYPMATKETGDTSAVDGASGESAGFWQLRKVLSIFHEQQQRASATRQGSKLNADAGAASSSSSVLTVAQRVAAAAALLRQEQQQQAANRSPPPYEAGIAHMRDINRNAVPGVPTGSNSLSRATANTLGRVLGEEHDLISANNRPDIAAVLLRLQKAAASPAAAGIQTQAQSPRWAAAASSAYAVENMRAHHQEEQKRQAHEGSSHPVALEGSRHRSGPTPVVARGSAEEIGAYCGAAEGAIGFPYRLQRQQQQHHMRSPPPGGSPTFPLQQRQRLGRHGGSRAGYVDAAENQYRHIRDGTLRQVVKGIRGNQSINAQVRSSSCVPLPSSLSETEQEESTRGVAIWEKVDLVAEQQQAGATAKGEAELVAVGAEGSRFVSHERAGIFCFGGRRGEAGELCNELRVLKGSGPGSFCWSTLPVTGTPPPPCSGMATILALRPASDVITSSSQSSPEQRKGEGCGDEVEPDVHLTTAGQEGRSQVGGVSKREGVETFSHALGSRNSNGDVNKKDALPPSSISSSVDKDYSKALDNGTSTDPCEKKSQELSERATSISAEELREGENAREQHAGTIEDLLGNGTDISRASKSTGISDLKGASSEGKVAERQGGGKGGAGGDRRPTLLVYGGRYVDGFADWTSLYECDLTTNTWTRLHVDISRLPQKEPWRSSPPAGAEMTSISGKNISSCSTAALSCDISANTSRTKLEGSEDTSSPLPPLPAALQESSWCYSELDDCVYVFGGVCRETQVQEIGTRMQPAQQQLQRKQHFQEQQEGEIEKFAENSSDDMEPSGSESRRGETVSVLARQLPPAWQCQNLLWRLELGRLQWTLVEMGTVEEETSGSGLTTGVQKNSSSSRKRAAVSPSTQNSHFGMTSSSEVHPHSEEQDNSDGSERNIDRCTPEVCTPSRSSLSCKREEEKVHQIGQDKGDGKNTIESRSDWLGHTGGGDLNTGRVALAVTHSKRAGDDIVDEHLIHGEDAHGSRRNSHSSVTLPKGRAGHSCVYKDGALWIFGGSNTQEELADFFRFDLKRQKWEEIERGSRGDAGRRPCARYGHVATVLGDFMILFGGYGGKQAFLAGGMQHPVQQQAVQQQVPQRQWSDSNSPPSGDGGAGAGCKRSVVFVDAVRIHLRAEDMLAFHQHVVDQRSEEQQGVQQRNTQHDGEAYFKSTSRPALSPHPELKKTAAKQDLQINNGAAVRETERFIDDVAQQRTQVSGGVNGRLMMDRRVNRPQSVGGGSPASSSERDRSSSVQPQVQRAPGTLADVVAPHDGERDAAGGIVSGATDADRISAVATAMLELLQQHASQKAAGGNNMCTSVTKRAGEGKRINGVLTSEERSRGLTTTATLNRLDAQLRQQLLLGGKDITTAQDAVEQHDRQGEQDALPLPQHQDLVRALQARLQDLEQKARTAESEQRHETTVLQEQIRRVSITLTTLYTRLWNAANEVVRGQKENQRLQSELAARDAVITRQRAELEAITAKYRRAQVEIAFLLKPYQQQGRANGSPTMHGNVNFRGREEHPFATRAGGALNMTRTYNVSGIPATADSFAQQRRLPQLSPPQQFTVHQKQDAQR